MTIIERIFFIVIFWRKSGIRIQNKVIRICGVFDTIQILLFLFLKSHSYFP
jgi:hypothetical protein